MFVDDPPKLDKHIPFDAFIRMLDEESELKLKIKSLDSFLNKYSLLSYVNNPAGRSRSLAAHELLLIAQYTAMIGYLDILTIRIDHAWVISHHIYQSTDTSHESILRRFNDR